MKKVLLAAALVVSAFAANAQSNTGKIYLGADLVNLNFSGLLDPRLTTNPNAPIIGFTNQSGPTSTDAQLKSSTGFGINVNGGYFFSENMAVGASLLFSNTTSTDTTTTGSGLTEAKTTTSSFAIMPYLRYMKPIAGKWSLMADAGISYKMTNSKTDATVGGTAAGSLENKTNQFGIFVRPGFAYSVTEKWTIFGSMTSNLLSFTSDGSESTTTPAGGSATTVKAPSSTSVGLNLNPIASLTTSLGLYYSFGGSK